MDYARPDILAEPDWLHAHLGDPSLRIIDCGSVEAYGRAHIPGAVCHGVHPFIKEQDPAGSDHGVLAMPPAEFAALMSRLGVGPGTTVVAYDDDNARVASRLWWVLNYYGHARAKVLNGGWHGWLAGGLPVTFQASAPAPATFTARPNPAISATVDELLALHQDTACQVLDARSDSEWDGTNDRGNLRAGHVPGARHLEWIRFVSPDDHRRFLPADDLQRLVDAAGIARDRPVITYCQGGIRAAHAAFVLTLLGYQGVRVYDGSMREWANRTGTPLVREPDSA